MAADVLAEAGHQVTVADAMPSVGRKFLMAGKSGLNLTKVEPDFSAAYDPMPPALHAALQAFGPAEVMAWAEGLGQPLFVGSTGRVFPTVMKASPLLRAWLLRLAEMDVTIKTRWRWMGWEKGVHRFDTPERSERVAPKVTILALGGASWARLGSDGAWAAHLVGSVAPFAPANMGFEVKWSQHMAKHFGKPIKGVRLIAGDAESRGEAIISARGLEGGGIYAVSRALREGARLHMDLLPDWPMEKLRSALRRSRGKQSVTNHLRKVLKLHPTRLALLQEFGRPFAEDLAPVIKALPVPLSGPHHMDEAISTSGGVRFEALDEHLMLRGRPGVFCAGEMLDWEAPTGGYLITGCLATGRLAGFGAARYLTNHVAS